MRRVAALAIGLGLLFQAGCSRHFVVPREGGRIDGERSIASYGDASWTIVREPAAATPSAAAAADTPAGAVSPGARAPAPPSAP